MEKTYLQKAGSYKDVGKCWGGIFTRSRTPRIANSSLKLKRDEAVFPWNLRGTTDLISDFWPARFLEDTFIVLIHPVCGNLLHQP